MDAVHPPTQKGKSQALFQKHGMSIAIVVPKRCSSTESASYSNAAKDPYLRALKQLSATHRPSLVNIPLERPTATDTSETRPPNAASARDRAEKFTGRRREIGRRYHRREDGGVDVEFVDVSEHQHSGHSAVNKVRPAIGIHPFHAAPHPDNEPQPNLEMPPAAAAVPVCPKQEDREARRSRWSQWHTAYKMKEQLRVANGSPQAPVV
ncbi:hypothetical protein B0I37DRAFT_355607 [Chaetomium sp. MPI-CAGE-AT-0009]|nr:hypothetical protein B0I37DRAFT_355607 [Chaetomium sp. MPI-CAGE-AT-0009]